MSIDPEKVEWMHSLLAAKQDLVPDGPDDMIILRYDDNREMRMKRSDLPVFLEQNVKLITTVKLSLGEAEKNAKGGGG